MIGIFCAVTLMAAGIWLLVRKPKPSKLRMSEGWRYRMVDESNRQRSKGWSLR